MSNKRSPLASGLWCLKSKFIYVMAKFYNVPLHWCKGHSFYLICPKKKKKIIMNRLFPSSFVCDSTSGSSQRGGAAVQPPAQVLQSPGDAAHLELPDLAAEDILELQLQQFTVAQFTVATMQHVIPLLKTGGSWRIYVFLFLFPNCLSKLELF